MLQGEVLTQVGDRKKNDGGRRQGSDLLTSVPFRSGGRCVGKRGAALEECCPAEPV